MLLIVRGMRSKTSSGVGTGGIAKNCKPQIANRRMTLSRMDRTAGVARLGRVGGEASGIYWVNVAAMMELIRCTLEPVSIGKGLGT